MKKTSQFPCVNGKISVAPSILSADLFRLGEEVKRVENAGADWLHVDVMDGHFVPNLSFGPSVVSSLSGKTNLALDVHLMVENPSGFVESFVKAGADLLTVHIEAHHVADALQRIRACGVKTGISIKPDTKAEMITPYLDQLDLVLVMSVQPGFGGQSFLPQAVDQIRTVRQLINRSGRSIWLEVDGGINAQTAPLAIKAGADALVAGNAIFSSEDPAEALKQIKQVKPEI